MKIKKLALLGYIVTWTAINANRHCDSESNPYTGNWMKTHCEYADAKMSMTLETRAGAEDFVSRAPSTLTKGFKVREETKEEKRYREIYMHEMFR